MIIGINSHGMDPDSLAQIESLRVGRYARVTVHWAAWETDPAYRQNRDAGLRAALARGFNLLVVVHEEPTGWTPLLFSSFVRTLAAAYPGVEAWQLGNERVFRGIAHPWQWADLHNEAAAAIRSAAPGAKIISLAFSPAHLGDYFYPAFLAEVKPRYLDAQAIHLYEYPLIAAVDRVRDHLNSDFPLWYTEFGMSRDMVPPERRSRWLTHQATQLEQVVARDRHAQRAYIYALMTSEQGDETHGIFERDWSARPAADWLRTREAA